MDVCDDPFSLFSSRRCSSSPGCASVQPTNDTATETPAPTDTDELSPANDETETNDTTDNTSEATPANGNGALEIHHLDVGHADATLVITPTNETILIDTGDWRKDGATVINSLTERGITRIDHLVATHGHADHIGGHAAVIEHVIVDLDGGALVGVDNAAARDADHGPSALGVTTSVGRSLPAQ